MPDKRKSKNSITLKIIAGYSLAIVLAVISIYIIYQQLDNYTDITKIENENNEKLFLIGEAITSLYEAESLTRNIIQTSNVERYDEYKSKIDSILKTIDQVAEISIDTLQIKRIDSIKGLIDSKNENFAELISVYEQSKNKGLQENVIDKLKRYSDDYGNYRDYDKRFKDYSPASRKLLKNILNWSKRDNAQRLTSETLDSVADRFYEVLSRIENEQRQRLREIRVKENKLLKNDQIITKQLRDLMAGIEENEREEYKNRLRESKAVLDRTSTLIAIFTAISLVIAIIFLILITSDISKSQQYRNELENEKNYTETLLKTRESIINTVTHDLRSPLNTVIGYSDLLEKTGLTNKQMHYLEHLKKSSDYILHLVNDLLDLSKLEAGRMVIEKLPFSPKKLIENTVTSVLPLQDSKNLKIDLELEEQLNKQFLSDPFRIKQVLTNLLNNAYKFTDEGTITIEGKILENGLAEKELVISVKDTGIGISEAKQKIIFEEFSQGDDDTEKKYGGFGLGLAITKKIIELLNGRVTLNSILDQGSNFTFYIPIELSPSQVTEEETIIKERLLLPKIIDKHVLIVDDDPSQLALTSEVVSIAGLSYDICENGKKALELLKAKKYDLVLSDIQMPKMDGFKLLKSIKELDEIKDLPVIALSGRVVESDNEYRDAGFIGSLRKPYAPDELLELIAQVLNIETTRVNTELFESCEDEDYSLKDLLLFAQGDTDSLYAILDTFFESTKGNLMELRTHIDTNNLVGIQKIAHKMLPMFKQIKAKKVIPILDQLEHHQRYELSKEQIFRLSNEVVSIIEELIEELKLETT